MRVVFLEKNGQRKFLESILEKTGCSSLRIFRQFGFGVPYSTMKNYFSEKRLLPKDLFDNLCYLAKIDFTNLKIEFVEENWGQVKGGLVRKRRS